MPESTSDINQDIERYRRLLERDPNSRVFAPLAEACRKANRLEEALAVAQSGVSRHPTYASGRVALARAQLALERYDEAAGELSEALAHAPENALAHRLLGEARARLGDRDGAFDAFARALALNPEDAEAREAMARLEAPPSADVPETPAAVEAPPAGDLIPEAETPPSRDPGDDLDALEAPDAGEPFEPDTGADAPDEAPLLDAFGSEDAAPDDAPVPEADAVLDFEDVPDQHEDDRESELSLDLEPLGRTGASAEDGPREDAYADLPGPTASASAQAEGEAPARDAAGDSADSDFGWAEDRNEGRLLETPVDEEARADEAEAPSLLPDSEAGSPTLDWDGQAGEGVETQDIWDREPSAGDESGWTVAGGAAATSGGGATAEPGDGEGLEVLSDGPPPEEEAGQGDWIARGAATGDGQDEAGPGGEGSSEERLFTAGVGGHEVGFELGLPGAPSRIDDAAAMEAAPPAAPDEPPPARTAGRLLADAAMGPLARRLEELDIAASSLAPEAREAVPLEAEAPASDPFGAQPKGAPHPSADALPLDRRVEELADQYLRLGYPDRARALYRSLLAGNPMNLDAQRKLREMGPEGQDRNPAPAAGNQAVRRKVEENIDVLNRWLANIRKGAAR